MAGAGGRRLNLTGVKRELDLSASSASSTEPNRTQRALVSEVASVPDADALASSVLNIPALLVDFQAEDFGLGCIELSPQTLAIESWQL